MLADHIEVLQAVRQQAAAPIRIREVIGNNLAADAFGLLRTGHGVGRGPAGDQLDGGIHPPHRGSEEIVFELELRQRHHAV
jgi:hypothetical protein